MLKFFSKIVSQILVIFELHNFFDVILSAPSCFVTAHNSNHASDAHEHVESCVVGYMQDYSS